MVKEVKLFETADGKTFETREEAVEHEKEIKRIEALTSYWRIVHTPDLTEGKGYYTETYLKVRHSGRGPDVRTWVYDYAFRIHGRPLAFIMGVAPMKAWILDQIEKSHYEKVEKRFGSSIYNRKIEKKELFVDTSKPNGLVEKVND